MEPNSSNRKEKISVNQEDRISIDRGCAIPSGSVAKSSAPRNKLNISPSKQQLVGMGVVLTILSTTIMTAGVLPTQFKNYTQQTAASIFSSGAEGEETKTALKFSDETLFSQSDFSLDTRDTFIKEKVTFIEANLQTMELSYFSEGELSAIYPIESKGKPGSWWETPSGLYEIQTKKQRHFSSFANVYLPWSMPFQGNFFIHGWPEYPSGEAVPEGYSGGCIRLSNADAKELYNKIEAGTPVLVHETTKTKEYFQYEPRIPDMAGVHYLLADVEDATVLASSDLNTPVPIASLTKLMTALVAAEFINLDSRVVVGEENFVQSLIPRLSGRQTVSMYSLLQLLLVESSNEAADVIADQLGRKQFINRMNEKAYAIGMTDTVFTDPSGLDDGNVSSLSDLLQLVRYIQTKRSFILKLTTDQYVTTSYQADEFGELENFNQVDEIEDFYAGKVGETEAAGQTSITIHKVSVRGEERLLAIIILGSEDREKDVQKLHSYFLERFAK